MITIDKKIIPVEKKIKWFTNFFITLLNDLSHKYITEKHYNNDNDTFQSKLKDAIVNNRIEDNSIEKYFKDEITNLSILNKKLLGHKKNTDLFDWMKHNNYINFFFFPYFIKFLNFKCITFEYYEDTLYGGIYNYLKKKEYPNKKYDYIINNYSINQSSGFDYNYSVNRHPEFLIINLWDDNDNLANLSTIKDDPKLKNIEIDKKYTNTKSISTKLIDNKKFSTKLDYNGYKYYLKSFLLDNYNTKEFKKPQHTITIISCENKTYAYTNTYISKSTNMISTLFVKPEEVPCDKLIEFNIDNLYKIKGLSLSDTECGLFDVRGNDLTTKYCYSLLKGRRVLIYVREQEEIKKKRDNDEKEAREKKEEEFKEKEKEKDTKVNDKKKETEAEKKAREEKENKDRICKNIFEYVDKIRTKIDKKEIDEKIKKDKDYITSKVKELEEKEKNYDTHKKELEKLKTDIEKMHKDNLAELKKYIDGLKLTTVGIV